MKGVKKNKDLFIEKYKKYYQKQPKKRPYTSGYLKEVNIKSIIF